MLVDAQVENSTPSGIAFQNASSGATYDTTTQDVGWQISNLAPGASESLSYTALLAESGAGVGTVRIDGRDALGKEASACDDVTVTTPGVPTPTSTPVPGAATLAPTASSILLPGMLTSLQRLARRLSRRMSWCWVSPSECSANGQTSACQRKFLFSYQAGRLAHTDVEQVEIEKLRHP
jgi:hypothetical protein